MLVHRHSQGLEGRDLVRDGLQAAMLNKGLGRLGSWTFALPLAFDIDATTNTTVASSQKVTEVIKASNQSWRVVARLSMVTLD